MRSHFVTRGKPPATRKYLINAERVFTASRESSEAAFDGRVDVLVSL